jgi:hypothetical protein
VAVKTTKSAPLSRQLIEAINAATAVQLNNVIRAIGSEYTSVKSTVKDLPSPTKDVLEGIVRGVSEVGDGREIVENMLLARNAALKAGASSLGRNDRATAELGRSATSPILIDESDSEPEPSVPKKRSVPHQPLLPSRKESTTQKKKSITSQRPNLELPAPQPISHCTRERTAVPQKKSKGSQKSNLEYAIPQAVFPQREETPIPISISSPVTQNKKRKTVNDIFAEDAKRRATEEFIKEQQRREDEVILHTNKEIGIGKCAQCEKLYERAENDEKACVYHPGKCPSLFERWIDSNL